MNDDLISREALKKSMRKSINERYISWTKTITVADIATLIFDEIEYAPTVEPEQITIKCDTEEDKQKLLLALRNAKLKVLNEAEITQGEWIVDQSPSYTGLYMVSIDSLVTVANFDGKIFRSRNDVPLAIDSWRPLPEPYKKAENDE